MESCAAIGAPRSQRPRGRQVFVRRPTRRLVARRPPAGTPGRWDDHPDGPACEGDRVARDHQASTRGEAPAYVTLTAEWKLDGELSPTAASPPTTMTGSRASTPATCS